MKLQLSHIDFDYQALLQDTGERSLQLTSVDAQGTVHLGNGMSVQTREELTPDEYEALKGIIASVEKRVVEKIKASI